LITIRKATETDCLAIRNLIRGLAEYEKLLDKAVATEESLRQTLFGPRPFAEVLLAEQEGKPIGFALYFFNYSTFLSKPGLYLEDLFVYPEHRGLGIGKLLFQELARVAVAHDCGRMEWMVLDWNEPAQGFYQRMGANCVDGWHVWRMDASAIQALTH
jgi:GNAT superfamily N-acetyltransferase